MSWCGLSWSREAEWNAYVVEPRGALECAGLYCAGAKERHAVRWSEVQWSRDLKRGGM